MPPQWTRAVFGYPTPTEKRRVALNFDTYLLTEERYVRMADTCNCLQHHRKHVVYRLDTFCARGLGMDR